MKALTALFGCTVVAGVFVIAPYQGDAAPPPASSTPVPVVAGQTTSGINTVLGAGASISGRLLDKVTGKPARIDGEVVAIRAGVGEVASAFADQQGRFTIGGLAASKRGYAICNENEVDAYDGVTYAAQCFPNAFQSSTANAHSGAAAR